MTAFKPMARHGRLEQRKLIIIQVTTQELAIHVRVCISSQLPTYQPCLLGEPFQPKHRRYRNVPKSSLRLPCCRRSLQSRFPRPQMLARIHLPSFELMVGVYKMFRAKPFLAKQRIETSFALVDNPKNVLSQSIVSVHQGQRRERTLG